MQLFISGWYNCKTKEILTFLTEHHKSRKCQQVFQKRGQLPSITRTFSAVYFCCDRISSLPNCSGKFLHLSNDLKISLQINSFIESNLIGADRKVYCMSLAIEVDNGGLRAHSPMKNKNKPPRLSTGTRYLSNLHSFNPYNSFKNELFPILSKKIFLKWVCSIIFLKLPTYKPI